MWRALALAGVVVMSVTASGSQGPELKSVMRESSRTRKRFWKPW